MICCKGWLKICWHVKCSLSNRNLNDRIELEGCALNVGPTGPSLKTLDKICGKIYAMLSDE